MMQSLGIEHEDATLIACSEVLSSVCMVDKSTRWDSIRVFGVLKAVYMKIVSVPKVMAAARLYQSELGESDNFWQSVWYVNTLLTCTHNDSDLP